MTTASYKITNDEGGRRYRFFCALSGARVYTSDVINEEPSENTLEKVWETARSAFNRCEKCGQFVCDAMYNADTFMCVDCSPWENPPKFCKHCGESVHRPDDFCRNCGKRLRYEGE